MLHLETELLREDLADLSTEISIKQKLIEELENSQKRLNNMKLHYEEKLSLLERKIKETETERDTVLDTIHEHDKEAAQQSQKVKSDYEKKINNFKDELKKLQSAKKEHNRLMRTKVRLVVRVYVFHLRRLRDEYFEFELRFRRLDQFPPLVILDQYEVTLIGLLARIV